MQHTEILFWLCVNNHETQRKTGITTYQSSVDLSQLGYAGINLTGYHPPRANRRATNIFRQNPRPGDSFSVQNSGPRVEKMKQNPHPRA